MPARDDVGLTLVEVMVTVAILGLAFVALVSGMFTAMVGADLHTRQAGTDIALRSYAEATKAAPFVPCASTYVITYTPPAGYTAAVEGVEHYFTSTGSFASDVAGCLAADSGLQRVTVAVTETARGGVQRALVVKRRS